MDEDRRRRLRALEEKIQDPRSIGNIDSLLDTVQALYTDCDHPSIRKLKNIDVYTNRCKFSHKNLILSFYNKSFHCR